MTDLCGHPTPSGPRTRRKIPGSSGCGLHPAPPDPQEDRHPEPVKTCGCDRPLALSSRDGEPARCFLCARALPGQPATKETLNGQAPVDLNTYLIDTVRQHRTRKLERDRDLLEALGSQLSGADFGAEIEAREQRVRLAKDNVSRHVQGEARTLLAELYPEARDAVEDFVAWARQGRERWGRITDLHARAASICTDAHLDRDELPRWPETDHFSKLVGDLAEARPSLPLPRSVVAEVEGAGDE